MALFALASNKAADMNSSFKLKNPDAKEKPAEVYGVQRKRNAIMTAIVSSVVRCSLENPAPM